MGVQMRGCRTADVVRTHPLWPRFLSDRFCGRCARSQRGEELSIAACPRHAGSAHAANDALCHQPLELLAGVLAALVRVMQQGIRLAAPPDRISRASATNCAVMLALIGPADHPAPRTDRLRPTRRASPRPSSVGEVRRSTSGFGRLGHEPGPEGSTARCDLAIRPRPCRRRRRGRARKACRRISRSIRCRPHSTPSPAGSRQTRLAHRFDSLALSLPSPAG